MNIEWAFLSALGAVAIPGSIVEHSGDVYACVHVYPQYRLRMLQQTIANGGSQQQAFW